VVNDCRESLIDNRLAEANGYWRKFSEANQPTGQAGSVLPLQWEKKAPCTPTAPFQEVLKRCRTPTATLPIGRQALWRENSTFWKMLVNWGIGRIVDFVDGLIGYGFQVVLNG